MLDLAAVGVDAGAARTITGVVSSLVAECEGADAMTGADMRTLTALEASKQSVGCDDSSGCLAELADALGARYVVYGDVGRLGESFVVNLNLFDSTDGVAKARRSVEVESLEGMGEGLRPVVNELLTPLGGIPLDARGTPALVVAGGATAAAGVLVTVVGAAGVTYGELTAGVPENTVDDKTNAVDIGRVALAVAVIGAVVTAAGGGLLLAGLVSE